MERPIIEHSLESGFSCIDGYDEQGREESDLKIAVISTGVSSPLYTVESDHHYDPLEARPSIVESVQSTSNSVPPAYEDLITLADEISDENTELEKTEDEKIMEMLQDIAKRCLHNNPALRPSAKELLKLLESHLPEEAKVELNLGDQDDEIESTESDDDMDPEEKKYIEKQKLKKEKKEAKKREKMRRKMGNRSELSGGTSTDITSLPACEPQKQGKKDK